MGDDAKHHLPIQPSSLVLRNLGWAVNGMHHALTIRAIPYTLVQLIIQLVDGAEPTHVRS